LEIIIFDLILFFNVLRNVRKLFDILLRKKL
jgi:hypothetical protein